MNYEIIKDEQALNKFIDIVLPNNEKDELFYISLLARSKWNKDAPSKAQLKRITSTKDRIVEKIRQMECAYGSYTDNGKPIPIDSLGLYIMPNVRSIKKAQLKLAKEIMDNVISDNYTANPQAMALTKIQQNCSYNMYYDLDVDINEGVDKIKVLTDILQVLKNNIFPDVDQNVHIIETRGGYHLLLRLQNIFIKNWYQIVTKIEIEGVKIEMNGDNLIPVPGCVQGGYIPKIIEYKFEDFLQLSI